MGLTHDAGAAVLRLLPAETAHRLSLKGLRAGFGPVVPDAKSAGLEAGMAGLSLPNPVGLAAGYDKDADAPDALLAMGFGFVEVGTLTPLPQPGNPRPRLFRLRADGAVINRMGFNNKGLAPALARLAARVGRGGVIGINVGANKDSQDRIGDYAAGTAAVWPYASYVAINVSSPNTPGLRTLQQGGALDDLLGRTTAERARQSVYKPLFLKVAPDLQEGEVDAITQAAVRFGLDGLIVSNTTVERPAGLRSPARTEAGGLSGRPLFAPSTRVLRQFAACAQGRLALIGAGGVDSGAAVLAKLKAGAGAVQLYTALALEGPSLVPRLLCDLRSRLQAEGFARVGDAVGADLL